MQNECGGQSPLGHHRFAISEKVLLILTVLLLNAFSAMDRSSVSANEDAKRLYDELLISYNRHRRPAISPDKSVDVRLKLRLSQIIDVVSLLFTYLYIYYCRHILN